MSGPDPRSTIPWERLPEGFAETLDAPPEDPVTPRPAATVVLMREGGAGSGAGDAVFPAGRAQPRLEVLLLRRVRSAGFVPGAWVFPGGRVDADDAAPDLVERFDGRDPAACAERLGLGADASPPGVAYWIAALREAFEESGLLVGRDVAGHPPASAGDDPAVAAAQDELLEDEGVFAALLDRMGCRMDASAVAYVAHWITPVQERRRYDARFFAAAVPSDHRVRPAPLEVSEHVWLPPAEALERHDRGEMPMVFPTLRTLEGLRGFDTPADVLAHWEDREVSAILPRLVRTPTGVGLEVP